jgi:hypothetical protein
MGMMGFWHFSVSRNPRNLRPEPSSLVSTSFTHSGGDEDSGDSGIISLFFAGISGIFPQNPAPKRFHPALLPPRLLQFLHFPLKSFISLNPPPTRRETKLIPVKKHCDLHRHFRPLWPYRKSETCCRGHSELYFVSCVLLAPAAGGAAWSIGALAAALAARPTTTTPADDRRR